MQTAGTQTEDRVAVRVEGISKRFGHTQALEGVSVSFAPGEVHALMGENGAGKSTLGKIIAGLHAQDAGGVFVRGSRVAPGSPKAAWEAGVRIVHQELAQCPNLTVAENLCLHNVPRTRLGTVDRAAARERAAALLAEIEPKIDPERTLGSLSPGHRQIVQIAGVLDPRVVGRSGGMAEHAGAPRVVIFDEPTSSLSLPEVERLLRVVRQLADRGLAVIYVSHRMNEIFECSDKVTVLRDGRYIATSATRDITEAQLIEQMIGRRIERTEGRRTAAREKVTPALEIAGVQSPGRLHGISLAVAPGEVLGIGGLVGSGRSELLDAVFGIDRRATGRIRIRGERLRMRDPRAAVRAGLGYVPEDRRLQGLFFEMGVGENILMPRLKEVSRGGVRRRRVERQLVATRLQEMQIKAASPDARPGSLSGGNQQKALIGRWLSPEVRVLLLDEPTRGIDIGTKTEVYRLIRAAADRGVAVVLVSSEMQELLLLSDRIAVLSEGRLAGELQGAAMTQARILELATSESRGRLSASA